MIDLGEAHMAFQFAGTPKRQAKYKLVGPLRTGVTVFITKHKTLIHNWESFDDFAPYVIGQAHGYSYQRDFDKAELSRNTSAQNPRQLVSMLLAASSATAPNCSTSYRNNMPRIRCACCPSHW